MTPRKLLRKSVASLLKRFYILTNGGYSIGKAYGARYLLDWRHSLDKKVAVELYEHEQIHYLTSALDTIQPEMFIDIGAHTGLYSIILKKRYPQLDTHAFEPDRTNLCQLYANLFVNRMTQSITVHEFGLSDHAGQTNFDTSEATSSRGTRRISDAGNSTIEIQRLDDVLRISGKIIAIKIDVEGHENQVIDGARAVLTSNKCFLQIESGANGEGTLKQKMGNLGYRWIKTLGGHDHYFSNLPHR